MSNTHIYLRTRKKTNGEQPINLRLTIDGSRKEVSLKRSINSKHWDKKKQRGKGNSEAIKTLNRFLRFAEVRIDHIEQELLSKGKRVTAEIVMNKFIGKSIQSYSLVKLFEAENKRVKGQLAPSTYVKHRTVLKHLKSYMNKQYGVEDIDVRDIDYQYVSGFDFYMRSDLNIGNNQVVKYVKMFQRVYGEAKSNGWVDKNPFENYKKKRVVKDVTCLSQKELDTIYNKEIENSGLERVRDLFVFSCYTSLAYCDLEMLTPDHIVKGIDGDEWIEIKRKKTDVSCVIPLLPIPKKIIEKYKDDPLTINKKRLLPVYSNQKMNEYLKNIGEICNIKKKLHFHMARHTFGTTIAAKNRLPIETTMKIMGHKTVDMARHYVKLSKSMMKEDVAVLLQKIKASDEEQEQQESIAV